MYLDQNQMEKLLCLFFLLLSIRSVVLLRNSRVAAYWTVSPISDRKMQILGLINISPYIRLIVQQTPKHWFDILPQTTATTEGLCHRSK